MPTHHDKIMKAKVREVEYKEIRKMINKLAELVKSNEDMPTVQLMKDIVPEFISNSSKYEVLDRKKVVPLSKANKLIA